MDKTTRFKHVEELCKPIREYLANNYDPHATFIISMDSIKVVRDEFNIPFFDEILD